MTTSPKVVVSPTLLRLMEARERLDQGYWLKGDWSDGYGGYCLVGALGYRPKSGWTGEEAGRKEALKLLVRAVGVRWYWRWLPAHVLLFLYNDLKARDKGDVLYAFDSAIYKACK